MILVTQKIQTFSKAEEHNTKKYLFLFIQKIYYKLYNELEKVSAIKNFVVCLMLSNGHTSSMGKSLKCSII